MNSVLGSKPNSAFAICGAMAEPSAVHGPQLTCHAATDCLVPETVTTEFIGLRKVGACVFLQTNLFQRRTAACMSTPLPNQYESGASIDRLTRGALAGALGGVIGAGAKLLGEVVFPPRVPGEPVPPAVMASKLLEIFSGSPLLPSKELLATQIFHWTFSVSVGVLYGVLAERFPRVTLGRGVVFGVVLCLATHETLLPACGFSLPWREIPLKEHLSELSTHALFGLCVELVRRTARRYLTPMTRPMSLPHTALAE